MTRESFELVLKEFGEMVGNPDLALDEEDYVGLATDQDLLINIDYVEDASALVMFTTIGAVPEDSRVLVHEAMLEANFDWAEIGGAKLCLDPSSEYALLMISTTAAVTVEEFATVIMDLSALTEIWSTRFEAIAERAEETEGDPDPIDPMDRHASFA